VVHDRWIELRAESWETPAGIRLEPWWMTGGADWAHVVAFTPDDRLVLVRQFRPGAGTTTLELPGGLVDAADADPLAAARREFREETGYDAADWRLLPPLWHDPAHATVRLHVAVAISAVPVAPQCLEPTEAITVEILPLGAALADPAFRAAGQVGALLLALRELGRPIG
jgi:8-oxo-dGTP pyrophosphatase MutT (NUDIX family)